MRAPIHYAKSGDVHVAYRVFGEGPRDAVVVPGSVSHVELLWEIPSYRRFLERLTAFARVIVFDKRGQGLSDRVAELTLDGRLDDLRAVMDAAGAGRATVFGWSEGGPTCLMFSATHPERVDALVLYGSFASQRDPSWEVPPDRFAAFRDHLTTHWGEGALLSWYAPGCRDDPLFAETFSRLERAVASPGNMRATLTVAHETDVRHLLPTIQVPTLILHRPGDRLVRVGAGRYLADHIPGARYIELPGEDHLITDIETQDVIADAIEELLTGTHRRLTPDRMLTTVLFIDLVGSTEHAATVGDAVWRETLSGYRAAVHSELLAYRGREVDHAGDGLLATFDGPARAIRCACSVRDVLRPLGLRARFGLHTGEVQSDEQGISGIAVHIGARIAAMAAADEVLVSSTVRDLVAGSGIAFAERGEHVLKGLPDAWRLYEVR